VGLNSIYRLSYKKFIINYTLIVVAVVVVVVVASEIFVKEMIDTNV
jgi:hypothetical protein